MSVESKRIHTLIITEEHADALMKWIGLTSPSDRASDGITMHEANLISEIYNAED